MARGTRDRDDRSEDPAHDILAAEEFGVPAPDRKLGHPPLSIPSDPDDPSGVEPPHDVLAAEEFAMPAGAGGVTVQVTAEPAEAGPSSSSASSALRDWSPRVAIGVAVALVAGGAVSRLRRRG